MKEKITMDKDFINGWNRNDIFKKTLKDIRSITSDDKQKLNEIKAFVKIVLIPFLNGTRNSILKRKVLLKELEDMFKQMDKEFKILKAVIESKDKEINNGK